MGHTNSTTNYNLPQFIGSDSPKWLEDINQAMLNIDTNLKDVSDVADGNTVDITELNSELLTTKELAQNAQTKADTADTTANSALDTAVTADGKGTQAIQKSGENETKINQNISEIGSIKSGYLNKNTGGTVSGLTSFNNIQATTLLANDSTVTTLKNTNGEKYTPHENELRVETAYTDQYTQNFNCAYSIIDCGKLSFFNITINCITKPSGSGIFSISNFLKNMIGGNLATCETLYSSLVTSNGGVNTVRGVVDADGRLTLMGTLTQGRQTYYLNWNDFQAGQTISLSGIYVNNK